MTKRIGIHLGTTGGASNAVEQAREIGANTFQIFSSSPRMWRAPKVDPKQAVRMKALRAVLDVSPLGYTHQLPGQRLQPDRRSAREERRGLSRRDRAGAHAGRRVPGAASRLVEGADARRGLTLAADSIARAIDGLAWQGTPFHILIENTAGSEFSLGGSFEQVAELVERLKPTAPMGVCLDTCHTHVAGYDLVTSEGYEETMKQVAATVGFGTVRVWHMNDAKAARGSKLDRHEQIGKGTMGLEPFRRLLNDPRFAHAAFIAETPVDAPGDEERNVKTLLSLVE
jgi:deoxyribonuclease-4